jgi:hypothetical protein
MDTRGFGWKVGARSGRDDEPGARGGVLLSGVVADFNLRTLQDGNQKIIRSHEFILALDELLWKARDAETGQRGEF